MSPKIAGVALVLALAGPAVVWSQSLGDVAKREEEKKKKSGKPPSAAPKVYTEEDLKKARDSDSAAVTVLPENGNIERSSSGSSSDKPTGGEGGAAQGERYWRRQAADRRDAVTEAEKKVRDLQARISALRTDISPSNLMDPNRLQSQDRDLRQAQDDLEAAQRELAAARQRLADLEDEARRAGALPGWVR